MIYVIDIDGTICTNTEGDYPSSMPLRKRIETINRLHDGGHKIILQTARGMSRANGNQTVADKIMREATETQLKKWNVKYDSLYLGKPFGDVYVDDKALKDKDFFKDDDN